MLGGGDLKGGRAWEGVTEGGEAWVSYLNMLIEMDDSRLKWRGMFVEQI